MSDQLQNSMAAQAPPTTNTPSKAEIDIPYSLTSNVPYISANPHPRHFLDVYTPKTTPGPFPCIIYIHGGAFKVGDKVNRLLPLNLLSSQTYAVASINYRLSGHAPFPAAVQDCKAAVRFLRANAETYNLDPARFVSMGESAGAYMAVMVGLTGPLTTPDFDSGDHLDTSSSVLGTIDFYGPTDFSQMDAHAPPGSPFHHDDPDSPESLFLGVPITSTEAADPLRRSNPIVYVGERAPPVLIAHGTADKIVPFHQSLLLERALNESGRDVTMHPVEGADHVFVGISREQRRELDRVVDQWLKRVVGV